MSYLRYTLMALGVAIFATLATVGYLTTRDPARRVQQNMDHVTTAADEAEAFREIASIRGISFQFLDAADQPIDMREFEWHNRVVTVRIYVNGTPFMDHPLIAVDSLDML